METAIAYVKTLRLFSRNARLYLITSTLFGFTLFGGIYSVLFNLYLLRLGYGPEPIGLVNSMGMLASALFSLPSGALGRRFGCRRMMIVGLIVGIIGNGILPLAEFLPQSLRIGWLLVAQLLGSIGLGLHYVNSMPFLMSATNSAERNHVFSVQAALWPLAGFAGSLVGGLLPAFFARILHVSLDQPMPYRYPLWIAVALLIPAVPVMLATREVDAVPQQEKAADIDHSSKGRNAVPFSLIAVMGLVVLLRVATEGATRTFFNVYLDAGLHTSTARIGALVALGQLLSVPAALAMPLVVARWGLGRTYVLGSLGVSLAMLPLSLIPHWGAAAFGLLGVIALGSIAAPVGTVYQMEVVPSTWQATMSGVTSMAATLSWAAMSLGGGYIIAALGYPALFLIAAGLTAMGALLFSAYFNVSGLPAPRRQPRQANRVKQSL